MACGRERGRTFQTKLERSETVVGRDVFDETEEEREKKATRFSFSVPTSSQTKAPQIATCAGKESASRFTDDEALT